MSKQFKVGDRVRVVETPYLSPELAAGAVGTVAYAGHVVCGVRIDGYPSPDLPARGWNFPTDHLAPLSRPTLLTRILAFFRGAK